MTPHRRAARPWCVLAVLAVLAGPVLGACGRGEEGRDPGRPLGGLLTFPHGSLDAGLGDALGVAADSDWVVGAVPVCSSNGAPVLVDGVRARDGDLEVTGFAIRDNPIASGGTQLGEARGGLAANGLTATPEVTLTRRCGEMSYELLLEIHAGRRDTSTTGFTVAYTSGGRRHTLDVPYEIHSCVGHTTPVCRDVPAWPVD